MSRRPWAGSCRRPIRTIPTARHGPCRRCFLLADEALYYANQFIMRSRDRGKTWEKISPDLARVNPPVPATLDPVTAKDIDQPMTDRFGVVYTLGPSPLQAQTVWAGTDDGLIYVTRDDGKNLEQRDAAANDGMEQGVADRGRPLRRRDRVCVGGSASACRQ